MSILVILHCVDDAKHFIAHFDRGEQKYALISTHGSVNDYLEAEGIECGYLSDHISYDEMRTVIVDAERIVDEVLRDMDRRYSKYLNDLLNTNMDWFYALYRHAGKAEYLGLGSVYVSIDNLMKKERFDKVIVYDSVATSFFNKEKNVYLVVKLLHSNVECIDNRQNIKRYAFEGIRYKGLTIKEVIIWRFAWAHRIFNSVRNLLRYYAASNGRKDTILLPPLYDLDFLRMELRSRALVLDANTGFFRKHLSGEEKRKLSLLMYMIKDERLAEGEKGILGILLSGIRKDFGDDIKKYYATIKWLDLYHKTNEIGLGVWGNSPVWKERALIIEYLLKNKIPVIGAQHGSGYCEQDLLWEHFDLDFNWCNYYLSYGFNEHDLKDVYPQRKKRCTIIPCGHIVHSGEISYQKEPVDLIFPITNSPSVIYNCVRVKNSDLTKMQRMLLEFLNHYPNKRIVIKPFPFSDDKTNSVIWLLKKLKNLEVVVDLTMTEAMAKYDAKAFLIEFSSTPLIDAMVAGKDSEIFFLNHGFCEFTTLALNFRRVLEKRVHVFDDVAALEKGLDGYFNGVCSPKRDRTCQTKYYQRDGAKRTVFNLIDSLYENSEASV